MEIKILDYNSLPYNCIARAAQRMRDDYRKTGTWNPVDERIVLGDPTKGVEMGPRDLDKTLEAIIKQFSKDLKK